MTLVLSYVSKCVSRCDSYEGVGVKVVTTHNGWGIFYPFEFPFSPNNKKGNLKLKKLMFIPIHRKVYE